MQSLSWFWGIKSYSGYISNKLTFFFGIFSGVTDMMTCRWWWREMRFVLLKKQWLDWLTWSGSKIGSNCYTQCSLALFSLTSTYQRVPHLVAVVALLPTGATVQLFHWSTIHVELCQLCNSRVCLNVHQQSLSLPILVSNHLGKLGQWFLGAH